MKPSPSNPTASKVATVIGGTFRKLEGTTSQRRPSLLKADVNENAAPILIDARRRLWRYAFCRNFFLTICGQQEGGSAIIRFVQECW